MRRDATVFAWLILILGVFGTANGSAILIRGAFHAEGASCKAICGIARLFADFFSPVVGAASAGAIYLLLGSCMALAGCLVLKDQKKTRR